MNLTVHPSALGGAVRAITSKSMAHRMLILAALAGDSDALLLSTTSDDIEATRRCLDALMMSRAIRREKSRRLQATASEGDIVSFVETRTTLDCGESGSTLRFLIPVAGALGLAVRFVRHGRLAERPLSPLDEQLAAHGVFLEEGPDGSLYEYGRLSAGQFILPGDVSSQYVSGLFLAAPLMRGTCEILVGAPVQSRPYILLTMHALKNFGIRVESDKLAVNDREYERFLVMPGKLTMPADLAVEGDWSNAAFWLAAGTFEREGVTVTGLDLSSAQGDRAILAALAALGARIARQGNAARATHDTPRPISVDVSAIPDLVPPLAAVAATTPGSSLLRNAGRLRLKESDRLQTIMEALTALGAHVRVCGDDLAIDGVEALTGGTVDACNDHRIAMMAAIAATHATGPVTILGAECVNKSYPGFWDDYVSLGGHVDGLER